jgi:hypothetical protein
VLGASLLRGYSGRTGLGPDGQFGKNALSGFGLGRVPINTFGIAHLRLGRRPEAGSRRTRGDVKSPLHRVAVPVARMKNRGPAKQVRATIRSPKGVALSIPRADFELARED